MGRCKFKCIAKNQSENGYELHFVPVTCGSAENESFFKWTPYGELTIGTVNAAAAAQFEPGKTYYLDLTACDQEVKDHE